ncbi:protein FAM234A isoform X3 [Lagenorhynchus albirostris]|uniref:protein FAM234A isoform X3 n=1 Tax=Lagenorhynchus albirostris TaxID=27610 RepID=UPI0028F165C8|nr:protein FAM234A isoform X3 [Lagenorhynchus albirostris]
MTDSKDLEAEIHPLKNENRKVQEHLGNPAGKETSVKPPPQSRLSRCRTVAFFLSLFVCLFVVFVVSFIIPCPDRLASQGVWRIDYKAAVAYDFLATEDVNKDRIQDVLFLYKNTNSSRSNFSLSCADEGNFVFTQKMSSLQEEESPRPLGFGGSSWWNFWELSCHSPSHWAADPMGSTPGIQGQSPGQGHSTRPARSALQTWVSPSRLFLPLHLRGRCVGGQRHRPLGEARGPEQGPCGVRCPPAEGQRGVFCLHHPRQTWPFHCGRLGHSTRALCLVLGETLWSHPSSFGGNVSVLSPLLQVPDIDADGVPDLLVLTQEENQVNGYVYSSGTGQQVGPPGSLGVDGTSGFILYVTSAGAHYVLIPCGTSLCSHSVKGLYEKATGRESSLKSDPLWEGRLNATSHRLQEHSSGAVRYLMNVPGKVGEDLLLVSSEACVLLDGQELVPRWTLGAAQVLRKPILGYYKPDTPAMVIENGTGSERQILLLDLSSGAVLWSQALPGLPRDPRSASLPTADHRSAFFFWGLHELAGANQTEPGATGHHLYMFHPTQPGVLLELANISTPIVTFQGECAPHGPRLPAMGGLCWLVPGPDGHVPTVVLLEPSRHAAYILLTGPASPDPPGLVSVAKHKVRDLIPSSKVVRLAEGGPDSDQAVRDRFSRLRYRNEA